MDGLNVKKKSKPKKPKRESRQERLRGRLEEMDWEWRKAMKVMEDYYERQIKRGVIV